MGIKAGRLAISQYFDQYQAGWQTALSEIYIYMEMANGIVTLGATALLISYLAQWHFAFKFFYNQNQGYENFGQVPSQKYLTYLFLK